MSIRLRKMTDEEYHVFCLRSVQDHAGELVIRASLSPEKALQEAEAEFFKMLPNGINTKGHQLLTIEETDTGKPAGFLWTIHEEFKGKKQLFLCDFLIFESLRRKGYGTAALSRMEDIAAETGCQEVVLFVSDDNAAAKKLYQTCGYLFHRRMDDGVYLIKTLSCK